ncbi:MAG TPA: ERCC4 domain-containing protein [Candidatus Thermoplasmatota archaeon]|nr:ERCC4 domain-containing protein [Candidatus Thermoplasmatota archaeon]
MSSEDAAAPAPLSIVVDRREPQEVRDSLAARGVPFVVQQIAPGDFLVGRYAVERKTMGDFFSSLIQKRLFEQIVRTKETYERTILLLEGDVGEVDRLRTPDVHWGALAHITADLEVPCVQTRSPEETAAYLAALYRRETREGAASAQVRFKPPLERMTLDDRQKFAIQGLPGVGDRLSEMLLSRFGSVRNVYLAREGDLARVPLIGDKKARDIERFLDAPFRGPQQRLPPELFGGGDDTKSLEDWEKGVGEGRSTPA